jgi:hypothetical protein
MSLSDQERADYEEHINTLADKLNTLRRLLETMDKLIQLALTETSQEQPPHDM